LTRLLLVEDEAISRLGLTRFLIAEGYAVTSVASGEEALKKLETESFDGVITDSKLGHGVSGIDILTRFERLNPGAAKLLITAYPPGHVGEQTVGALYVSKPIDLEELLLKLKSILPVNGH
jgi:DNA-binding response OmpR family regulator